MAVGILISRTVGRSHDGVISAGRLATTQLSVALTSFNRRFPLKKKASCNGLPASRPRSARKQLFGGFLGSLPHFFCPFSIENRPQNVGEIVRRGEPLPFGEHLRCADEIA